MSTLKHNKITVDNVIKLTNIFNSKKWPTHDDDQAFDYNMYVNFCHLLGNLSDDEQELLLTITDDFLKCTFMDYHILMRDVLKKVDKYLMDNSRKIIIVPLVSPKDAVEGKVKSSHSMLYNIIRTIIPHDPDLMKYKDKVTTTLNVNFLCSKYSNRQDNLLIFFDDFIGSGQTAFEALWDYWFNYRVESDSVAVVALVAQFQGFSLLKQHFFDVYAVHVKKRGISDSNKIDNTDLALSIMDRIENNLAISKSYHRGFGKCEALVSMMRTPNNTFPIYWCSRTKTGEVWPAPFQR